MCRHHACPCYAAALALMLCSAGCNPASTVIVHVWDAETDSPINDGRVCVRHAKLEFDPFPPRDTCAPIVAGGTRVRAVHGYLPTIEVTAPGYLEGGVGVPDAPPKHMHVRLYREPAPAVEVILPTGYRGAVAIGFRDVAAGQSPPYPPGKRQFSLNVAEPEAGVAWFVRSPLVAGLGTASVKYMDGTALPRTRLEHPNTVAFREVGFTSWPEQSVGAQLFFVGTLEDYYIFLRQAPLHRPPFDPEKRVMPRPARMR